MIDESYSSMQERENWCEPCRHPDGYHHLCKKGKCRCSVCKFWNNLKNKEVKQEAMQSKARHSSQA